jgi:2-dehydro-3-deoxy-D-gluconate 5-dehydrogenase
MHYTIEIISQERIIPIFLILHLPPKEHSVTLVHDLFALDGRLALVTGGNGGLGRAMALGLKGAGARVVITGRNVEKNAMVAQELGNDGAVFELDVRDEAAVQSVFEQVASQFGPIQILVNNAGVTARGTAVDLTLAQWHTVLETHLTGSFLCAQAAARQMISAGDGGKIINIGSMYSIFGPPNVAAYAAAKTGIVGLTRALAVELASNQIQVNAILPGWYETDLNRTLLRSHVGEQIRRKTPARRLGVPQDLIGAAIFLASAASDFVTGTTLVVDGGYSVADRPWEG